MKTKQVEMWKVYHDQIEKLIENEGFENCLQWKPILKAVFVGNAPHIRAKARIMFSEGNLFPRRLTNKQLVLEPGIGNPSRLPDHPFTSGTRVNMLWHIRNLKLIFKDDLSSYDGIFEFGGGYGCLCEMVYQLGFSGKYFLYDVPTMTKIQKWYTSQFGLMNPDCISDLREVSFPENSKKAFVGMMSYTEIPMEERKKVEPIIFNSDMIFIAFATQYSGMDNNRYIAYISERLQLNGYTTQVRDIDEWRKGKKYFYARKSHE